MYIKYLHTCACLCVCVCVYRTLCALVFIMHLNTFISNFSSRAILAEREFAQSTKRRWTSNASAQVYVCVCASKYTCTRTTKNLWKQEAHIYFYAHIIYLLNFTCICVHLRNFIYILCFSVDSRWFFVRLYAYT